MEDRSGIAILDDRLYDKELGVVTEGKEMDTLMFGQ
jgi:hypothetical protein